MFDRSRVCRWLVSISYRFSYYDDVAEKCHVVERWRTTLGKRFAHVPVGVYALVRHSVPHLCRLVIAFNHE